MSTGCGKLNMALRHILLCIGVVLMSSASADGSSKFKLQRPEHYFQDKVTRNLLEAVLDGDVAKAKQLVAQGVDPNAEGPSSAKYNKLRLLHYAIADKSEKGVKILLAVGADPEMKTEGTGRALSFALTLDERAMISLILDHRPINLLSRQTLKLLLFESILLPRPECLELLLSRGAPIDFRDDAGYTILMSAMDVQDYDVAEDLMEKGASIHIVTAAGVTPAYLVEFHLKKFKPGTPIYNKVLHLKEMMAERGAVFPAPTPAEVRAKRAKP